MTKILSIILGVALAFAVTVGLPAQADTKSAPAGIAQAVTLDPMTLTTATAFDSGVIDTSYFPAMTCEIGLTSGDPRAVIPKCYAEKAGTNLTYTYPTLTVATASTGRYVFDPYYGAGTDDTNTTASPASPCRFIKITAASAGPGVASCTLRRY